MIKSSGIIRSRKEDFLKSKGKQNAPRARFNRTSLRKKYLVEEEDISKISLLSKNKQIELVPVQEPIWMQDYQACERGLRQIDEIIQCIQIEQNKKMSSIDEHKHQLIIQKRVQQSTKKIQYCQKILKNIESYSNPNGTSQQQKIFSNTIVALAMQIKERTKKIRNTQQTELNRNREINKFTENAQLKTNDSRSDQSWLQEQTFEGIQQKLMANRNQQIMKIVKSVQSLNGIYKQLQSLVIQQGSLLDRIDYNIDSTVTKVQEANQHLQKAEQHQQSSLANKVRCILIIAIAICLTILCFKFL